MATSPIYNWPEPDNTDLVKNGALAIRTLGNAIDTTMATMTPKSIVDAKGDLIAATANDTPARLAVGANNLVLMPDSSTATGLKYGGEWVSYTPTFTNLTIGNGTLTASYVQIGKLVTVKISIAFGSTTAFTGAFLRATFPVTAVTGESEYLGLARYFDAGTAQYNGMVAHENSSTFIFAVLGTLGTYSNYTDVNGTTPMIWTTSDYLTTIFTYRAA